MEVIIGMLVLVGVLFLIGYTVRFIWRVLVGTVRLGTTPTNQSPLKATVNTQQNTRSNLLSGDMSAEEEGNVHSGPYGYSPNTPYPETQYGSDFNPDAEWNHEEQ